MDPLLLTADILLHTIGKRCFLSKLTDVSEYVASMLLRTSWSYISSYPIISYSSSSSCSTSSTIKHQSNPIKHLVNERRLQELIDTELVSLYDSDLFAQLKSIHCIFTDVYNKFAHDFDSHTHNHCNENVVKMKPLCIQDNYYYSYGGVQIDESNQQEINHYHPHHHPSSIKSKSNSEAENESQKEHEHEHEHEHEVQKNSCTSLLCQCATLHHALDQLALIFQNMMYQLHLIEQRNLAHQQSYIRYIRSADHTVNIQSIQSLLPRLQLRKQEFFKSIQWAELLLNTSNNTTATATTKNNNNMI